MLKYSTTEDVINLGWLPMQQRVEFELLKLAHKSIHLEHFPSYLKGFNLRAAGRPTRNVEEIDSSYLCNVSEKLFIGKASRLLNDLPKAIREEADSNKFHSSLKKYLLDVSLAIYIMQH